MSILQQDNELRYVKRQNLEHEAKVIGNYYRDIIRSYGVDCLYLKHNIELPKSYNTELTKNNVWKMVYGYDSNVDYTKLSANMITYMEVENDIFLLNKYGYTPEVDTNFYFDINEFAATFATQLGSYIEYQIPTYEISGNIIDGNIEYNLDFITDIVSGRININSNITELSGYIQGSISDLSDPIQNIPVNEYIARYKTYDIVGGEIPIIAFLKYDATDLYNGTFTGTINGSYLYYNLSEICKYIDLIRPKVGDVICVDFPNSSNSEQYEITDCFDKKLTTDGINPLLHKYIWKCKATRRIDSHENINSEEMNSNQFMDILKKKQYADNDIANQIEDYSDSSDDIYGGYDNPSLSAEPDYNNWEDKKPIDYETVSDMFEIVIFGNGSILYTDGYDLFFKNTLNEITQLTTLRIPKPSVEIPTELKYLKATDKNLFFMDIEGDLNNFTAISDNRIYDDAIGIKTFNEDIDLNQTGNNFYKFRSCRTILFCNPTNLYVRMGYDKSIIYELA